MVHFLTTYAQQEAVRLIVRGDDMGFSHAGNEALIKSYKEGIVTSIEVIVPSPWFPEAIKLVKENPGMDVGIHLAITSEWDNIKWRPLTDCSSLKDNMGYFYPMVFPNKNYPGKSISENQWKIEDVEKELRAQIEMGLKYLPGVSHVSAHMGCSNLSEEVKVLIKKLVAEYNIPVGLEQENIVKVGFGKQLKTSDEKINRFIEILDQMKPGKLYLFVEHPGLDNNEMQAIFHVGYEDVASDRQGVTDVFTNEKIKALIRKKGIQLISYKDLVPSKQ